MNKEIIIKIILISIIGLLTGMLIRSYTYKNEDVNKDGKVDIKDLLIVQKYILEKGE